MAKHAGQSPELLAALREMGIDVESTRRIVIDIRPDSVPIVHVEQFISDKTIDVIRTLAGVEINIKEV